MKRSEINLHLENAKVFFDIQNFKLPPFAYFTLNDWQQHITDAQEIFDLGLGWDITDFGGRDFNKLGLLLFTIRNGQLNSITYPKNYAEKIMIVQPEQVTPMHYHWNKVEDIINRGGGELVFKLYNSTTDNKLANTLVHFVQDGIAKTIKPGKELVLQPGESITLTSGLYHTFWGRGEDVLVGEVSMVNDDNSDNCFYEPMGRFPEIVEDEPSLHLLCNDYKTILQV